MDPNNKRQGQPYSTRIAAGALTATGGGLLAWRASQIYGTPAEDLSKYPRLAELRKVGSREGFYIVSKDLSGRSKLVFGNKVVGGPEELPKNFKGIIWDYESFPGEDVYESFTKHIEDKKILEQQIVNRASIRIGNDKWSTFEHFRDQGLDWMHPESIVIEGKPDPVDLLGKAKALWGAENVVIKDKLTALQRGVWFHKDWQGNSKLLESIYFNPEEYMFQKKFDNMVAEFRTITVGGKQVFAAHRFGPSQVQSLIKDLEAKKPKIANFIKKHHLQENIFPVMDKKIIKSLSEFSEKAGAALPKGVEIMAWDIGMNSEGKFTIFEGQRIFGTVKHPLAREAIEEAIVGRKPKGKMGMIAAGVLLGGGLGYFGTKRFGAESNQQRYDFQNLDSISQAIEEYGVTVGTAHKRIAIPKDILSKKQIEKQMGFVPVTIAIPESGQENITSWRHPESNIHIHSHDDFWTFHEDKHAAGTMLVKKILKQGNYSPFKLGLELLRGIPHAISEGVPGAYYWAKGELFGEDRSMVDRIFNEMKDVGGYEQYLKRAFALKGARARLLENRIPGGDDAYNTIEGLRHGGMAEKKRRELTEFGSGWRGMKQLGKSLVKGLSSSQEGTLKRMLVRRTPSQQKGFEKTILALTEETKTRDFYAGRHSVVNTLKGIKSFHADIGKHKTILQNAMDSGKLGPNTLGYYQRDLKNLQELSQKLSVQENSYKPLIGKQKLTDPRKAVKYWQESGGSLETFADKLGFKRNEDFFYANTEEQSKEIWKTISEKQLLSGSSLRIAEESGVVTITTDKGDILVAADFWKLRKAFLEASQVEPKAESVIQAMNDPEGQAMSIYHELLEKQSMIRYGSVFEGIIHSDWSARPGSREYYHAAGQVLFGEGGFLKALNNPELTSKVKEMRYTEELKHLEFGFSGFDDNYNTIEGFQHKGLSAFFRKIRTAFGSGYDRARQLAKWLGQDYEQFLSSGVMREALEKAVHVKQLGAGMYGKVDLFETVFRKGQEEQKLLFVKKSISKDATELIERELMNNPNKEFYMKAIDFQREANVMKMGQETSSIATPYHVTGKAGEEMSLFMEYMPGERINKLRREGEVPEDLADKIRSAVYEMTDKKIAHQDIHGANVLYDKDSGRVSLLDFGLSEYLPEEPKSQILAETIFYTKRHKKGSPMYVPLMPDEPFKPLVAPKTISIGPMDEASRTAAAKPKAKQAMNAAAKRLELDQQKIWEAGTSGGKSHTSKTRNSRIIK